MNTQKFSIPKPCHESWDNMTPDTVGRFCGQCTKTVVDFTGMTDTEIENYLRANSNNQVCGRFKTEQLQPQKRNAKMALASLIVSVSAMLISCNKKPANEGFPLGEVAYPEDTITSPGVKDTSETLKGKVAIPDSLQKAGKLLPPPPHKEDYLTGDIIIDTTQIPKK